MSEVEANVAIMNGLYNNWSISNPGQDTIGVPNVNFKLNTKDPTRVHFTTRRYAYAPLRTHSFQISVRRQNQPFQGLNMGRTTKYQINYGVLIELWVLTGPGQSIESAETALFNMKTEVNRILQAFSTQLGSNIQSIVLGSFHPDEAALEEDPPKLHERAMVTAILYLVT